MSQQSVAVESGGFSPASRKVFVSYAWGDTAQTASEEDRQRQEVVERLCQTLEKENWQVVRDKTALHYGDLISTFINTLGEADLVIVVLSAKYLRSPYCMTELHQIYRRSNEEKGEFLRRIKRDRFHLRPGRTH